MRAILSIIIAVMVLSQSCMNKETTLTNDDYAQVFMPQASKNTTYSLTQSEEANTIIFGGMIGGVSVAHADIPITFKVDPSVLDALNLENETDIQMLPSANYVLEETEAVIPKGKTNTAPLRLSVFSTDLDPLVVYALPISLEQPTGMVKINPELSSTVFLFSVEPEVVEEPDLEDYEDYSTDGWQIVDYSSFDPTYGAEGDVESLLDEDPNTFWVSRWSGSVALPPHHITVDMGEVKPIHGISFMSRIYYPWVSGHPKTIQVLVSMDNNSWTDAGTIGNIPLPPKETPGVWNRFFVPNTVEGRYVKVVIHEMNDSVDVATFAVLHFF